MSESTKLISPNFLKEVVTVRREEALRSAEDKHKAVLAEWMALLTREYIEEKIIEAELKNDTQVTLLEIQPVDGDRAFPYKRLFYKRWPSYSESLRERIESLIDTNTVIVFAVHDMPGQLPVKLSWSRANKFLPLLCFERPFHIFLLLIAFIVTGCLMLSKTR